MSNHIKIPRLSDTVLVNFSRESPTSDPILIVGRKRKNQSVEIINAFQGDEAVELSERILVQESVRTTKKNKSEKIKAKIRSKKNAGKERVVVREFIDEYGNETVEYDDGSIDTIDIPF